MTNLTVSQLTIYPVKSAAGIPLNTMELDLRGPKYDRRWMVVDDKGLFITQRTHPKMCLIKTQLDNQQLILRAESMPDVVVGQTDKQQIVTVWGDEVAAVDCGDQIAKWLTQFLEKESRLVYMPDEAQRHVPKPSASNGEIVSFADAYPLLIATTASLQLIADKVDFEVSMSRFRPNIVIDGCEPFAEDDWQQIKIGEIDFALPELCSRCVMPSVNQTTAEKNPELLKVLAKHRRIDGKVMFGQNAIHQQLGRISVGDVVKVAK